MLEHYRGSQVPALWAKGGAYQLFLNPAETLLLVAP